MRSLALKLRPFLVSESGPAALEYAVMVAWQQLAFRNPRNVEGERLTARQQGLLAPEKDLMPTGE